MSYEKLVEAVQSKARESRTVMTPYSFGELANLYREEELVIAPDYQRLFRWSDEKQSQFIESLLLDLPVPPLFLIQREDETYELVDGLQRVSTYLRFTGTFSDFPPDSELLERVRDPLILTGCDVIKELNGLTYDQFPPALAIRLRRSRIDCAVNKIGSDPNMRYRMFKRLNSGGETLSAQESRNSFVRMLDQTAVQFIVDLSTFPAFQTTIEPITEGQREQRFDQELVLRFLALLFDGEMFKHDIQPFLDTFIEKIARGELDRPLAKALFEQTFTILATALGERAFTFSGKLQFSALHFEGIAVATALLVKEKEEISSRLPEQIEDLKRHDPFLKVAQGGGKNSRSQFRLRVNIAKQFIKES